MKKFNFSYDLTGLSNYTDEVGGQLISQAVLSSADMGFLNVIPGVKNKQALNILTSDIVVTDGNNCGFTPDAGTDTTFTQRVLEVASKSYQESLCPQTLNTTYQGMLLNAGSTNEELPYEEAILGLKVKQISDYNAKLIFTATDAVDGFDGFKVLTSSATAGVIVPAGLPAYSSATALETVDTLIENLPQDVQDRDDLIVAMSWSNYRAYIVGLRNANFYEAAYSPEDGEKVVFHPGTKVIVRPFAGLQGSGRIFLTYSENLAVGVDLLSDEDTIEAWYSMDNQEVRFNSRWKIGSQVSFPGNIVSNDVA